ncbi:hypothetical protein TNCV_4548811 [Trichonephila clavipes]|nr:hypothetical protein TNCV_4548811 [Trichonephila clavipes]
MLRPIQRIYPLEIRSNENLQRGMEESIPTVSETLSPDETDHLIGTSAQAPQCPMITHTEISTVGLDPHGLLRH